MTTAPAMTPTPPTAPTPRQRAALLALDALTRSLGYPPTSRELAAFLGHSSDGSMHDLLGRLRLAGLVTPKMRKHRMIRLTERGREVVEEVRGEEERTVAA